MSRAFQLESVSDETKKKIMKDLVIKIEPNSFNPYLPPTIIYPFEVVDDDIAYIPFAYACDFSRPDLKSFPRTSCKFSGELRSSQKRVKEETIVDLNNYGSTIISCYPGFGKTSVAINIATKIHMKTLIIAHRIILIDQWTQSISKFCPTATVQTLTPKSVKKDCDFYIMNAINVVKRPRSDYTDIAFVVVDEIHLIMSEVLSKCMNMLTPRYLLGLSATPYREDGMNILIDLFFGTKKIHKKLFRQHTVYRVDTGFVPDMKLAKNGKVDWGSVLESQCTHIGRNELIIRIIKNFPDRVFLVLCKRVNQGNYIVDRLREEGEDVTSLIGKQQTYEQKSRILVGTASKTCTGFDHPRLDAMIMASDIQSYYVQYIGRCMRTETVVPIIFDIVDKNPILEKHFKTRCSVYLEHGGTVKNFGKIFPNFNINL